MYREGLKGQAGPGRNFSQPEAHLLVHLCKLLSFFWATVLINVILFYKGQEENFEEDRANLRVNVKSIKTYGKCCWTLYR